MTIVTFIFYIYVFSVITVALFFQLLKLLKPDQYEDAITDSNVSELYFVFISAFTPFLNTGLVLLGLLALINKIIKDVHTNSTR
jgi:hypothetical protein